ncbi:MAG: hypothetical protein E7620_04840 [Ruminococcaceae bacterium]|nr:hypothetical protein [Oscillospiraceae bacterium]
MTEERKAWKKSPPTLMIDVGIALVGGLVYYGLEHAWRGYSHWSMALCGGICAALIYEADKRLPPFPLLARGIVGGGIITLVELTFGLVLNLWLEMGIWDYSHQPLQWRGQICLLYSLLWCLLATALCGLFHLLRRLMKTK